MLQKIFLKECDTSRIGIDVGVAKLFERIESLIKEQAEPGQRFNASVGGLARYGRSHDGAAIYDAQAGLHFLLYQPAGTLRFETDVLGVAINWVDSATPGARALL